MKGSRQHKGTSILRRTMAVLLLILMTQMLINVAVFLKGGILSETEQNSFYILTERTANRKLYLENEMVQRWSNVREGESGVLSCIGAAMAGQGVGAEEFLTDRELCQEVLSAAAPEILDMLRRNGVTGAFLILNAPGGEGGDSYPGIYLRDYDPIGYSENNKDVLLERGLPSVARQLSISMDSYWTAECQFQDRDAENAEFFFHPVQAAGQESPAEREGDYYYHWSGSFTLNELDREALAYSKPLIWEDGTILGVIGVDVTTDYLSSQLKYDELSEDKVGAYFLGISQDGGETYEVVCSSGPNYRAYFGTSHSITARADSHAGIVTLEQDSIKGAKLYGAVQPLKLYNANTPFEGEQWALVGFLEGEHLLAFPNHIRLLLVLSTLISLALGVVLVWAAVRGLTRPIVRLVDRLRRSESEGPIQLEAIGLTEIDALTGTIEELSRAATESAARVSTIISMTQIPIGVFEYKRNRSRVFCSKSLFEVLGWEDSPEGDTYLPQEEFARRMREIERNKRSGELVYRLVGGDGYSRWVQLFYRQEGENVLGAFLDVTADMEAKRKMEYERDFDILTGIYNRRAFDKRVLELFQTERRSELKTAALLMLDLDNLKYVNDSYGHDSGDRYIQSFARCLECFYRRKSLVGRRSGDEFNVFLYGCESQDELRRYVEEFWALLGETGIALSGGEKIRIRASGGLAWYPDDAVTYQELLRLSDFAMYSIKRTVKGIIREFDAKEYKEKSILIQGQDALNRVIENRLIRYAFQPIVSARDGSVYGYELLMRPLLEEFTDLKDLFQLAKAQSKLWQMEELTWFEALEAFARQARAGRVGPDTLAFVNSIGSQCLAEEDLRRLEAEYSDLLSRLVVEITENEEANGAYTDWKREKTRAWGAKLALDDYGTGFNSESQLITASPDIVKVDISIIHGIDADADRRALLTNLLSYAKTRNILVLAEGVETEQELETLIACGVDYLQGFYVGTPEFEIQPIRPEVIKKIRRLWKRCHDGDHP